ncbi:hypothetical protein FACS189499_05070 [Clostridia bacterium]|nr:hypothetical protein FACS189499_05070 [Clostridia bacterium]
MNKQFSFTQLVGSAAKIPFVRIDRADFLTNNLSKVCTPQQLQAAITDGTLHADIPIEILDSLAKTVINAETLKVTAISAAAGIPGGIAIAATIPADLAQFYGFVIRVAQELAYIYGWREMFGESDELDMGTEAQLILFIGVMSGVSAANGIVAKLFGETAMKAVAKNIANKALMKTCYYPIVKKIAALLGQRMTKEIFAKGVAKFVPVIGGVISGGVTLATFKPMAHKLQKHLSNLAHMSPKELAEYQESIIIDGEIVIDEEVIPEDEPAETEYVAVDISA